MIGEEMSDEEREFEKRREEGMSDEKSKNGADGWTEKGIREVMKKYNMTREYAIMHLGRWS